jgi:hypothetical protein
MEQNMREDVTTPKKWMSKGAPAPAPAPAPKPAPPAPKDTRVADARAAISNFIASAGDLHIAEVADALRKLDPAMLRLLEVSVPVGQGRTAGKCERLRQVFQGIRAEVK